MAVDDMHVTGAVIYLVHVTHYSDTKSTIHLEYIILGYGSLCVKIDIGHPWVQATRCKS